MESRETSGGESGGESDGHARSMHEGRDEASMYGAHRERESTCFACSTRIAARQLISSNLVIRRKARSTSRRSAVKRWQSVVASTEKGNGARESMSLIPTIEPAAV